MTRTFVLLPVLLVTMAAVYVGCGSDDNGGNGPQPVPPPRVVAEAHQDPTFDNALISPVWDSIPVEEFPAGTDTAYNADQPALEKTVKMKALIADDSLLYIWTQWNDFDADNRFGELRATWANNLEWGVNYPVDTSEDIHNEDRFYIIFDRGGPNGANCAAFCHAAADTSSLGRRFYGSAGDDADVWHWKAHRTGLARLADDMHMTTEKVDHDPIPQLGDSLYFRNYTVDQFVPPGFYIVTPKYMHESGPGYEEPGLLESEATGGMFTPYDGDLEWYVFPPPPQLPHGRTIPGYFIRDVSGRDGSRWDVQAMSAHFSGAWTVVFRRALTTGDADDIDFNFSVPDSIAISIGITENSGIKHWGRAPFYLVFP